MPSPHNLTRFMTQPTNESKVRKLLSPSPTIYRILGTMTGTSADGIDLGVITTDGEKIIEFGAQDFFEYAAATRANIKSWFGQSTIDPMFSAPAEVITNLHHTAIKNFFSKHHLSVNDIDAVGFHGQTIYHAPQKKITCQLGNGEKLAQLLNAPVVWQFRQRDIMMGGQGAPLMPLMHQAVADFFALQQPVVFLNIGGVANITLVSADHLWAGDVGPGNALIDDYAKKYLKTERDEDGAMGLRGAANKKLVAQWLAEKFFDKPIPKSLDRDYFAQMVWRNLPSGDAGDDTANDLATLSFFTATAIAHAIRELPQQPTMLLLAGGGRRNRAIVTYLKNELQKNIEIKNLDDATDKHIADNLEAFGFGFLAARVLRGLPLTLPTTTGVIAPTAGGVISRPV